MAIIVDYKDFYSLLKFKQQNIKEFINQSRELASIYVKERKFYTVFRIAKELQEINCDIEDIENLIVQTENPLYILKFAVEMTGTDIKKLQKAIIDTNNYEYIAKFGCYVNGADTEFLEKLVIDSGNAKAAFVYLKSGKYKNINQIKKILIKSKKSRYLYFLAKIIKEKEDIEIIQNIIIKNKSNMYVRLFAQHVEGVNLRLLEDRIILTNNISEMHKFATQVNSDRIKKILLLY